MSELITMGGRELGGMRSYVDKLNECESMELEQLLQTLCGVGAPKLFMLRSGWHCDVEMHVAAVGATFSVASDFGKKTPRAAALQATQRVVAALERCA